MAVVKEKVPSTPAIRMLRERGVEFIPHFYDYEERGGTKIAARELAIDEHQAVKTIVMENEKTEPFIVLMHGDREISTKNLARETGAKTIHPCDPKVAQRHTGYMVGGTSPFGTRKRMTIYMEESILESERIFINGGRRGLLIEMAPAELVAILHPVMVNVGY